MSKKPAKSNRSVNLPDWADEVTPADEVMRKFYAPTGAFKPGPIVPPELDFKSPSPEAPRESTATQDSTQQQEIQQDTVVSESATHPPVDIPHEDLRDKSANIVEASLAAVPERPASALLPPSTTPSSRPLMAATTVTSELPLQPRVVENRLVSAIDKPTSFEDFARKWKMYLYPGQLSVMRILYESTYAVGVTECFTRYSEIARLTKMSRRNCINVVNSLVYRGFIERIEVRNDASAKGIRLRVYLEPAS